MYGRIIRNDVARSRLITLSTTLFVGAAALLVTLAAVLTVNLTGAIDALMARSLTPHFLQMHAGDIDEARLRGFAVSDGNVDQFQVLEFLNVDGSRIELGGESLASSTQDNGLCVQSGAFDFLLDLDGEVIQPSDGEVYVPIAHMKDGSAKVGDRAVICGKPFTVAGFLRDSQMNSTLSSSKRFLISERDFAALRSLGSIEYLIEFRLKDVSKLGAFETAYGAAGLEANGPTLTHSLFRLVNAIDDGTMIAVLLLVSALVVAIAFLCIRFTLLAKLEDDCREIGVMKAIGLRVKDIKRIYLAKYAAVAAAGCSLGYGLSFAFRGALLENIRLYMGQSENADAAQWIAILGVVLVFVAIVAYVNRVLRRIGKISAVQAMRSGAEQGKPAGASRFRLSAGAWIGTNAFLGVKDVLARKRLYATMLVVLVLASFLMIVPENVRSTLSGDGFIRHMGIGDCDILVRAQQAEDIGQISGIETEMASDTRIAQSAVFTTKLFNMRLADGTSQRIKIGLGDHALMPVSYTDGHAPQAQDEIALSVLNANALGLTTGDPLMLMLPDGEKSMTVCGIYSDITDGGKTAKASFEDETADVMWTMICAKLQEGVNAADVVADYAARYPSAKVSDIGAHFAQTLGGTIRSMEGASKGALAVALVLGMLVTLLFMKMLIAKDRRDIAVLKAIGFRNRDIAAQFAIRSVFVLAIGVVLGMVLANTLGEALAGLLISSLGAASVRFEVNPLTVYLMYPAMMACAVLIATLFGAAGAGRIKISESIKE